MSKKELRAYFNWFQQITPERIVQLTSFVQSTPGFEDWQPDFSPDSLDNLGDWFAGQIETRPLTREGINAFNPDTRFPLEVPDSQLTNRTFSLAMDIGMYLNQVFLRNNPLVRWDQPFENKRYIDYGQPVLLGFDTGAFPFNAVRGLVTMAYSVRDKKCGGESLREIYEIVAKRRQESEELQRNPRYHANWKLTFSFPALLELITRMTVKESYAHSDDSVAWQAHREAETLADPSLVEGLAEYVAGERDKQRRGAAYFILGNLGQKVRGSDCAALLLSRVSHEQDKYVLSSLLDSLSPLPKPGNLDLSPVYRLLQDRRWLVRHSAIQALCNIDAPEAEDQLIQLLKSTTDQNDMVYCQGTLSKIGTVKSLPHLQKNLASRKKDVKMSAGYAIEAIESRAKRNSA